MPREFSRALRVADQIQRELADLITREVADPRLHHFTISGIDVSGDLRTARVFVTPERGTDIETLLDALNRARGYLRSHLARRVRMRGVPRLTFVHDRTLETAERLSALMDETEPPSTGNP